MPYTTSMINQFIRDAITLNRYLLILRTPKRPFPAYMISVYPHFYDPIVDILSGELPDGNLIQLTGDELGNIQLGRRR